MKRTVRQRSGRRKRAIQWGGRGGKVRGQGETRVRARNKGVEREEERMGEENGRGGGKRRDEWTGTGSQTIFCLMCVTFNIDNSQDWPPMQTGVEA